MGVKLLFIFAHPDDEAFGAGGTMARYSSEGADVHLVTATDGEGNRRSFGNGRMDDLGAIRRAELGKACAVLGVRGLHLLGYPDRFLEDVPRGELKERLRGIMGSIGPQVVVTFPPHGITGHPDHRAVSRLVTEVFDETAAGEGACPQKLYYIAMPRRWLWTRGWLLDPLRRRRFTATPQCDITTVIDIRGFSEIKKMAMACHDSQIENFGRLERYVGKRFFEAEHFVLARRLGLDGTFKQREEDLMEGLGGNP